MRVMNDVIRPFIDYVVFVHLDDILAYNHTLEDHLVHLKQVLQSLLKENMLKMSKCEFGKQYLVYLGHVNGGGYIKIDP